MSPGAPAPVLRGADVRRMSANNISRQPPRRGGINFERAHMTRANIFDTSRTITVTGAPGTGKTREIVIPALIAWRGSSLVFDARGDLHKATAERLRDAGTDVHQIEVRSVSVCFAELCKLLRRRTAVFVTGEIPEGVAEMFSYSLYGCWILIVFDDCENYLADTVAESVLASHASHDPYGPRVVMTTQRKDYPRGDWHIEL